MRVIIFVLAAFLATSTLSLPGLTHEQNFQYEDIVGHTFLNDMVVNTMNFLESQHLKDLYARSHLLGYKSATIPAEKRQTFEFLLKSFLKYPTITPTKEFKNALAAIHDTTSEHWNVFVLGLPAQNKSTVLVTRWDSVHRQYYVNHFTTELKEKLSGPFLVRYVSEFGDEISAEAEIYQVRDGATEEELRVPAFNAMVAAMGKIADVRHIDPKNPLSHINYAQTKAPFSGLAFADPVSGMAYGMAMKAASATIAKVASTLIQLFSTKVKTELMKEIKREGFTKYSLSARVRKYDGIRGAFIGRFVKRQAMVLSNNHPKHKDAITANLEMMEFMPEHVWKIDDVNIDTQKGSEDRFFNIMYNHDMMNNKYNFLTVSLASTFHLAPTLVIYRRTTSKFGGLFGSEEALVETKPPFVTATDIEAIRLFNLNIGYKLMLENLGHSVHFPQLN